FFFQAEDGIRDDLVTGVQTCALPISSSLTNSTGSILSVTTSWHVVGSGDFNGDGNIDLVARNNASGSDLTQIWYMNSTQQTSTRSEERRVGKDSRGWQRTWRSTATRG